MAGTFPISGQIEPKSFPFLLSDLHRNSATGSLKVEGPTYQKALYFRAGRILFGSSNDPRDQLGAILIEEGRITPEQLEDVNSKVGPGNPLAKVLAETGFVSQRELSEAARAKVERILSDLIAYTSGTFEFEDGVLPKGAVDLKLSTERLLLTAVRRVSDRGFVLRHLESLDVVLRPTADLVALRGELESETGGLLAHLDGTVTLKEATGRTRLDDFEAAKVASALLFLGVVERVDDNAGTLLDLGDTARVAFEGDEWAQPAAEAAAPEPPPRPAGEDSIIAWASSDPLAFAEPAADPPVARPVPPVEPAPEPEPVIELPIVEPVVAADPPPAVAAPEPQPEPARPAPPVFVPPPPVPAVIGAPSAVEPVIAAPPARVAREWTPPGRKETPAIERPPTPAAESVRPSKADMAALDALLDPRAAEGPLEPLERTPEPRWNAQTRGVQARRSSGAGPMRLIAMVMAVLLLGGGAAAWYLLRTPGGSGSVAASDPVTSTTTATPPPPAATPAVPEASPPGGVVPAAAPTQRPAPLPTPATPEQGVARARDLMRRGQLDEAARHYQAALRAEPPGSLGIQLFVACAAETVHKALAATDSPELYILPVKYQGRNCYRMCWGVYGSAPAAAAAAAALPEYFVRGGASPKVMPASELLR